MNLIKDQDSEASGWAALAGCLSVIFMILLIPILAIYNGWLLTAVWTWFMVPLGLPVLPLAHAIGIIYVMHLLFPSLHQSVSNIPSKIDKWDEEGLNSREKLVKVWMLIPKLFIGPAFVWFCAYIAHLYM